MSDQRAYEATGDVSSATDTFEKCISLYSDLDGPQCAGVVKQLKHMLARERWRVKECGDEPGCGEREGRRGNE